MRRLGTILATAVVLSIAAAVAMGSVRAPVSASGPGWKLQATVPPSGAQSSALQAVQCNSASACIAVGAYTDGTGTQETLAERWNGTGWAITATPNPSGATSSSFQAVACTSASACTAVGSYQNTGGTVLTLVERWNGTSWTIQSTSNPSGVTKSQLLGVGCASSTACAAVGFSVNASNTTLTLTQVWNGSAWAIKASPNPSGATLSELRAVSCASTTSCLAVGSSGSSSFNPSTLSERWNGSSWSLLTTPNVSGATLNALQGVACPTANACIAVGYSGSAPLATATLAEHLNGTVWTIQPTPNVGSDDQLMGLSCTSTTACTAVGGIGGRVSAPPGLAEEWDGGLWATLTTAPNTGTGGDILNGVSCASATVCTGVGFSSPGSGGRATLRRRWSVMDPGSDGGSGRSGGDGLERNLLHVVHLVHRGWLLQQRRRPWIDAGGTMERPQVVDAVDAESERREQQFPAERVVLLGKRLHSRRRIWEQQRRLLARGAMERHQLDDPGYFESRRGQHPDRCVVPVEQRVSCRGVVLQHQLSTRIRVAVERLDLVVRDRPQPCRWTVHVFARGVVLISDSVHSGG